MRKFYTFVLFLLLGFTSYGQAPFANNISYQIYTDCNNNNNDYYFSNFLQGVTSQNGIDLNSVDLDVNEPGIQSTFFGNVSVYYNNNTLIVINNNQATGTIQVQYTFMDNLGNISNIGSISIYCIAGGLLDDVVVNSVTCDNPIGQINLNPYGEVPFTLDLYRQTGGAYQYYNTYTFTNYTAFQLTNLPYGYYKYTTTYSCGLTINSTLDYQRLIRLTNPLTGTAITNYMDFNNNGVVDVGDTLNYQYTITNNSTTCTMTNVRLAGYTNGLQIIPSILPGASNSSINYTRILSQSDINNGLVAISPRILATELGIPEINLSTINYISVTTNLNTSSGVKLNAFIDSNNNGVKDATESYYTNGTFKYQINSGAMHSVNTNSGELYLYETNPANVYNLSFNISENNNYCGSQYTVATNSYTNITIPNTPGITTYNFPITVVPCADLNVNLLNYWSQPMPGFTYKNRIRFTNDGNQLIPSGTITFVKDTNVTITSTLPFGSVTVPSGFNYNFTNLQIGETRNIDITMQVPTLPTVALGQHLTNLVQITPSDSYPNNNNASLTETIIGAYDPNDKQESHGERILLSDFTSNDYLTYTIRYENTGTANAINIRVNDVLDSKLDANSIRMVEASHPYVLDRVGNTLNWRFNGVNFPPSLPNSTTGHGYIIFQIKPNTGYAVGDIIPNFANIYFDYNPAIVTNTVNTEFVATLSNTSFAFTNFNYYPNPVKNTLTISNASIIDEVEISSVIGQKIRNKKVNDWQTEIDLSELPTGIYFVKVTSIGQNKTVKIIKE